MLGIFANKAVKEKIHYDDMTRTCMFKFLKGYIEYLAQRLQLAKCIVKDQNVIMKPTPGKLRIYRRQSVGKKKKN